MTIPSSRSLILWISVFSIISPSADFGRLQKTSDFFGNLRKWSCRFQKSQHSQDKNLTPTSQKKLAGIVCIIVSNSPTHSRVYIRLCKHGKCFLLLKCKPSTSSGVCITVENSPKASTVYIRLYKRRKKVFYCFYKTTFPRKKRKTLCMALIKREILTSRKILSTKSCTCCTRNQFLFCEKMLCKIRIFFA